MGQDNIIDPSKKTAHTTLPETPGKNAPLNKTNGSSIDISDKTVLSEKHVKEFTPLLEKPNVQVAVSDKHKELIEAFKTLKQHGLTVKGTDIPDKLHSTLENIAPTTKDKDNILLNNLFAPRDILGIEVGKDTQSSAMTTIYLPAEQILSLSEHLKAYKTTDEIEKLKELTNKGAELYLKFHPSTSFCASDHVSESHAPCVKVNPEIFHWFMNNPTYKRKKNVYNYAAALNNSGFYGGGIYGQVTAKMLFSAMAADTTIHTVLVDGFMDAKADGEPNEPAIHGSNWKKFSANLEELSSQIDKEAKEKKTVEKEFNLLR